MRRLGMTRTRIFAVVLALALPGAIAAQTPSPGLGGQASPAGGAPAANNLKMPFAPYHLIGNIYYVGSAGLACYLITTSAGNILLDTGYPDMASQIEGNIQALGFKLTDIKILLSSHAHIDHGGGMAEFKRATGAGLVAMAEDAPYFESGGHNDVLFGDRNLFPPVHVDRLIHDGDRVTLGGVTMTAHRTPGHTPGNTTWTMVTSDQGKTYHVVFFGIVTPFPNTDFSANRAYPNMKADWQKTMEVLPTLPCDVFLASNGSFYNMEQKHDALLAHADPNPFIDPAGCKAYVDRGEATLQKLLAIPPTTAGSGMASSPPVGTVTQPAK
jgi:metallo-beta-lactamase class B